jgi:ATP-dependent RNA helicase RhlE
MANTLTKIKQLKDIERLLKRKFERDEIEGFEPKHNIPDSPPPAPKAKRTKSKQRGNQTGNSSREKQRGQVANKSRSNRKRKPTPKKTTEISGNR